MIELIKVTTKVKCLQEKHFLLNGSELMERGSSQVWGGGVLCHDYSG